MKHKKLGAVLMGIMLGIVAPFGSMALSARNAEATILVFDKRNVEEAIKEAIQTANILTTEQKELALKILNMKSLNVETLVGFLQQQAEAQQANKQGSICKTPEVLEEMGMRPSILNQNTTATHILQSEIGTIQSVIDGDTTLVDLYKESMKNRKAMDATYQAAAEAAQYAQASDGKSIAIVNAASEQANNAEGQKQVMQAQATIQAAQATEMQTTNTLLANSLAMQAMDSYTKNYEKARALRTAHDYDDAMDSFFGK